MGLLTPLYLIGLAALALPVVFHLLRKSVRKELPFSSLMFLKASPPRLTRRSRIEHWWLLALRALILALLVLAFTRPLFRSQQTSMREETVGKDIVVLVDQSASMQRGDVWARAQQEVLNILQAADARDRVSLLTYDQAARIEIDGRQLIQDFDEREAITVWARESQAGWAADDLVASVQGALDWYRLEETSATDSSPDTRLAELHIVSDFQAPLSTAWNQVDWPGGLGVKLHEIAGAPANNASMTLLQSGQREEEINQLSLRLTNDATSSVDRFTLVDGQDQTLGEYKLLPGQSRVITLAPQSDPTAVWRVSLIGDDETFDNVLELPPVASRKVRVSSLIDDSEVLDEASWMLEQACQSLKFQDVEWTNLKGLEPNTLEETQALFVLRPLTARETGIIEDYLVSGGQVIAALPVKVDNDSAQQWSTSLASLARWPRCTIGESENTGYALISSLDTTRPPLSVFRASNFRDFTSIKFWKHRTCEFADADTRILATFDEGDPFLLQKSVDEGELLVCLAGWNPTESQLGQNSRFATLMIQLAGLRQLRPAVAFAEIGGQVELGRMDEFENARLVDPQGVEIAASQDRSPVKLSRPGLYRLEQDDRISYVVCQVPSSEREAEPNVVEQLSTAGLPSTSDGNDQREIARQLRIEDEQLESRQQIWRWLLIVVIVLLLAETLAGGWLSRGRTATVATDG